MKIRSPKMAMQENPDFYGRVFACIERALSTYGEDTMIALYHSFMRNYGVSKDSLASSPLELGKCLQHSFGNIGGSIVERLIVREIARSFDLSLYNVSLKDSIEKARAKCLLHALH